MRLLAVTLLLLPLQLFASNLVISGYVRDATSGEVLSAATLRLIGDENAQTQTNDFGFYSLSVPQGSYRLSVSRVGYTSWESELFTLQADTTWQIKLELAGAIEEVVVTADRAVNQLTTPIMGLSRVDVGEISQVPVLFGEKDVLKTIQLLPGVMSGGEGSSQFFVRGGMGDQNLILLDGATVFNASHLFGFFSTFNSDAIRDVDLYKGGQPAQYGGRLASVLDIRMLEGNNQKFHAAGGIGLIASRLKVEGPLVRDKASFMVSGRRTYADLFLKLSSDPDINQSQLYFYDLNLKTNFQLNDKNTLYLSGYFGEDILGYADVFRFGWGNSSATLRWNHLLSNRLFSNTTAVYSDYDYQVDLLDENVDFVIASSIRSANLKQDFQFFSGNNQSLRFGAEFRYQQIQPSEIITGENASVNALHIEKQKGIETAAYISHEWDPLSWMDVIYGLRATHFSRDDAEQTYLSAEPRLAFNFKLGRQSSIKTSYNRNSQFLHQLTNTTSSLPTDAWVLSSERVKPQLADQYALGYYRNFSADLYEFSMEVYYKDMQNQIDYRDAADLQANARVEEELVFGIGRSYGVEWYLKKQRGRWN
ncbi:MAG TPA: TonB-dependent receptor, partial [Sphingobacteriaceae bacterium]|nr:TonB-dependent receptor [Sphingobacteriaceae bacterium]